MYCKYRYYSHRMCKNGNFCETCLFRIFQQFMTFKNHSEVGKMMWLTITLFNCRMLAYKAEDMHKRLKPDELVEREVLEQSIQDEVAAHCIQLWMKRYLRTVVDNFSRDTEDQVTIM